MDGTSLLSVHEPPCLVTEHDLGPSAHDRFYKSLSFSPDGNHLLASQEDCSIGVYDINPEILMGNYYTSAVENRTSRFVPNAITPRLGIHAGESVYDCAWYPFMAQSAPETCCFVSTCRDHPLHLWDSNSGHLRATYRAYDHLDEISAANSVTFNLSGDRIYAGYNRMIRWFDTADPGRNHTNVPTSSTRKAPDGQKGIISCLIFNPDFSGAFAAGSYSNSIGIYVENNPDCVLQLKNLDFAVTCMRWSRCGRLLFAGGRKHPNIVCWDVRGTRQQLMHYPRACETNQKMHFDLDPWGSILVTGTQNSNLLFYDVQTGSLLQCIEGHPDCVNSACFHPYSAIAVSATGQRHFGPPYQGSSTSFKVTAHDELHDYETDADESGSIFRSVLRCYSFRRTAALELDVRPCNDDGSILDASEQQATFDGQALDSIHSELPAESKIPLPLVGDNAL